MITELEAVVHAPGQTCFSGWEVTKHAVTWLLQGDRAERRQLGCKKDQEEGFETSETGGCCSWVKVVHGWDRRALRRVLGTTELGRRLGSVREL